MTRLSSIILLLCAPHLTGCLFLPIPHDRPITPRIIGVVVDETTKSPIKDANVSLWPVYKGQHSAITSTDGTFELMPMTEDAKWFYIWLIGVLEGGCAINVKITHEDYLELDKQVGYFGAAGIDGQCSKRRVHAVEETFELVPKLKLKSK